MESETNVALTRLVLKRWRICLAIWMTCVGLAGLAFVLAPRKYEAVMKLLVKNERADLVLTPGKNSSDAEHSEPNETEVNSEMELLRSRDILEAVTRDARLYQRFETRKDRPPSALAMAQAVRALTRALNVTPIRKTNIISVSYTNSSPEQAAFVVRDLGERYLNAHIAVHSAPGSYNFFADESAKFREQQKTTQNLISEFHRRTQIFSMPQQNAAVVGHLEETKAQLSELDAQIRQEATRLAEGERELAGTAPRLVTQVRHVPNQLAAQQLQTMLTDLQNRRIALAVKFKASDRAIVELDHEIQNTQGALHDAQTGPLTEQTSDVNTIHQSLAADLIKTRTNLEALKSRRGQLEKEVGQYVARLDSMDKNAGALRDLEQAQRQAEDNYLLYSRRLEEARMAESLDQQKFANVTIIEQPVASPIPVSPKLGVTLAVGTLLGIVLSLAIAFLLESGDRSNEPAPRHTRTPSFEPSRAFSASSGD